MPPRTRAPRADAARNREAIVDAAVDLLSTDPRATLADIAAAADVGRITLYGHFASREELLDAAMARALEESDARLAKLDLGGDTLAALERLVRDSWRIVERFQVLLGVVEEVLGSERIREHHGAPFTRIHDLLARGRAEGVVRDDLPLPWLTACVQVILHGAAVELRAGRLDEAEVSDVVTRTVLALVRSPARADG
jgi:AcrR family transcriptional regulator